jgi:hypothetical protein
MKSLFPSVNAMELRALLTQKYYLAFEERELRGLGSDLERELGETPPS